MKLTQGEIGDRISILEMKVARGAPDDELKALRKEWHGGHETLEILRRINANAWDVIERIHAQMESDSPDLEAFFEDCKKAHKLNQARVGVKNEINAQAGDYTEWKSWKRSTS